MRTPIIAAALAVTATAHAQFVEQDVEIIHTLVGDNPNDNFGANVCAVADFNHDGAMEFLVSAPGVDVTENGDEGAVHLYDGASGIVIRSHFGRLPNEKAGYVCDAGDVNADGITDYLFGTDKARVYVYSGEDGSLLHQLDGPAGSWFGFRACGVGDLNGDGHGEIVVGAYNFGTLANAQGRVFVYSGLDGSLLRTHDGTHAGAQFGHTVSLLGDLNADNVPDYSVGAPGPWSNTDPGQVFVYSGATGEPLYAPIDARRKGVALAGWQPCQGLQDFNGDNVPDFTICDIGDFGAGTQAGRHYRINGATGEILNVTAGFSANSGFGGTPWTPAGSIGDITGDCRSDGLIASWRSQVGAPEGGQVHLYDITNRVILRTFTSDRASAYLGGTLSGAGDANGDGITDYILAANGDSGNTGAVYVVAGRDHRVPSPADINGDGVFDNADIQGFIQLFLSVDLAADLNQDSVLDHGDLDVFVDDYLAPHC